MENRKVHSVLLVDDEPEFHVDMRHAFTKHYVFEGAQNVKKMWQKLEELVGIDLLILDLKLEGTEENIGLNLIPEIREKYPKIPIVIATKENDPAAVIEAMEKGAKNFLYKGKFDPVSWDKKFLEAISSQQVRALQKENKKLKYEKEQLEERVEKEKYQFIGESDKIHEIKDMLEAVAQEPDLTVLITGETGVGKEVAARFMHKRGPRHNKPFVAVNLSAIPKTMLESALFGHKKGAFTDAKQDLVGYFQQANKGILMLDEIGDIDADIQIKLLRFLEEQLIRPLGTSKDIPLNVQIIAATNKDLHQEVKAGRFRNDLHHRLKTMVIEIPPLRERQDDIPLILEHYIQLQFPNSSPFDLLNTQVIDQLLEYDWPGNIRELKHTVEYMLLRRRIFKKEQVDWECLPNEIREYEKIQTDSLPQNGKPEPPTNLVFSNRKEEQIYQDLVKIDAALRQASGSKTQVANMLGYKGTDHLRSRIVTCFKNMPEVTKKFIHLKKYYSSIIVE